MQDDKISVIIPVHNSALTLKNCVDSVIKQTYRNLEIILVNNGSSDDSLFICQALAEQDKRVRVIHLQEGNVSKARNAALNAMTGQYFAFVDSDDYLDITMYEKLYNKALLTNTDMVFCYFNTIQGNRVKPCVEEKLKEVVNNRKFQYIFKSGKEYVKANIWRTLFKASKLQTIRFDENLFFGEDFAYMFEAFQSTCNMVLLEECLYNYTLSATTMSKKYFNAKMLQNDKIYAQRAYNFLLFFNMLDYAVAVRYGSWVHIVHSVLTYSEQYRDELSLILSDPFWNEVIQKDNYKIFLKLLCPNFKYKARAYLLQHKMFGLYRILIRSVIR